MAGQVTISQKLDGLVDCLPGDIFTGHAFTEAFGSIIQEAADDDIVGGIARVRGMADRFPQRDANLIGR